MHDIDTALSHFKRADPILHKAGHRVKGQLSRQGKIRGSDQLFAALAESVVSQQLSVKASDTIWTRVKAVCGGNVSSSSILTVPLPRLRKAGLSAAKAKTLKELAKAVQKGLDLPALRKKTQEEAQVILMEVWGIGPWTCQMFLMFALGHPDIFSARDLGLMRSMETLYGLKRNTPAAHLEKIALAWSPHRTMACRILWKARDSV